MNPKLDKIVTRFPSPDSAINYELLSKYTTRVDLEMFATSDFQHLQHLNILGTNGVPEFIWTPRNSNDAFIHLEAMSSSKDTPILPGCYVDQTRTWMLLVAIPEEQVYKVLSNCSCNLEKLEIRFTSLKTLPLSHLTGLGTLNLDRNRQLHDLIGLEQLHNLQELSISYNAYGPVLDLNPYSTLRSIHIGEYKIHTVELDHPMPSVQELVLSHTPLQNADFLIHLPNLRSIFLFSLPLQYIPEEIRLLTSLDQLILGDLNLIDLPDWLPDLGLSLSRMGSRKRIYFFKTNVQNVDMSIFNQSDEFIRNWFRSRREGAPLNEVKVVFLGDGEAGKTHTIARLLNNGSDPVGFDDKSTPGVVIKDQNYRIGDRDVKVHFWDFGGQEILHSMHRMFLTSKTLYVVLINARDDTQDDRARYWLHNIKSFARDCPVLLVLNKMDMNENASVNLPELKKLYPGLTQVVKLSALKDSQEDFNRKLTDVMVQEIGNMDILNEKMFASWQAVKNALQGMTQNYIFGRDYVKICQDNGIPLEGETYKELLGLFHNLGVTVCYRESLELRDYVVLRPNWIINAVYAAIFNKHPENDNGLLSHNAIFEILQGDYRRTNPDEQYHDHELKYILGVFRRFGLSFQVGTEQEFIPMLCQRDSLPVSTAYAENPNTLEFQMTFDYLPSNVLHRLMVEMRKDLNRDHVWRTGALFEQPSAGLSAVVLSEGNILRFYAQSTSALHHAGTYLCELMDSAMHVVKTMGIQEPFCEVIYKDGGISQAFPYDRLIEMQKIGQNFDYSSAHRRMIPIDSILTQSGYLAEKERNFVRTMLICCLQLQKDMHYWKSKGNPNSKEDPRNTYIRNLLQSNKIFVGDQSFSGTSAAGIRPGELDGDIRFEADVPLTIFEGLNISSASPSNMENWCKHLQKLIHNYNPNGLPYLFLISYVDCARSRFNGENGIGVQLVNYARSYTPEGYQLQYAIDSDLVRYQLHGQLIRILKAKYIQGGTEYPVYHIFLQLGN